MRLVTAIGTLLIFCAAAVAQEEIIVLNSEELGAHRRPAVHFKHEEHADLIECRACHHDYDVYGVNMNEGDGERCAECHTESAGSNPVPLMRAFHLQCKQCHQNLIEKGEPGGPLLCGRCHAKNRN